MIQLTVNGQPAVLAPNSTVLALLDERGLVGKRVAVERNGEIVPKARHAPLNSSIRATRPKTSEVIWRVSVRNINQ